MVALDQRLLAILICPVCRAEVAYRHRRRVLVCQGCARVYAVRDGIPVMLPEPDEPAASADTGEPPAATEAGGDE